MTRVVLRKELTVLWLSPVPYVVAALFHLVLGVLFVGELENRGQAVVQPLFPIAGFLLLAVLPVVTMRTLADEARSGSLDLLLAIPLRPGALVVGKWLATTLTGLVVLAPALLFIGAVEAFGTPDRGPGIAGFIGLALLVAALCALGVLASSLTSSQPIAGVLGLFVSLLLWFAHAGSEQLSTGSVLARLSISERLRGFASGAVAVADVAFFLTAVAVLLLGAVAAVEARRDR